MYFGGGIRKICVVDWPQREKGESRMPSGFWPKPWLAAGTFSWVEKIGKKNREGRVMDLHMGPVVF